MSSEEGYHYNNTHQIFLYGSSYPVRLTEEGYTLLMALVAAHQVCVGCYTHFSQDNPNVAGNYCLRCFQTEHPNLQFQGELPPKDERYPKLLDALRRQYWFLGPRGFIYTTDGGPDSSNDRGVSRIEAKRDLPGTLVYWHFPMPAQGNYNGHTYDLSPGRISNVYGNVQRDRVVVIAYSLYVRSKNLALYVLSQRGGQTIQISNRKPAHRALLAEAERTLPKGYQSWEVHRWIARRLSQELAALQGEEVPEAVLEDEEYTP